MLDFIRSIPGIGMVGLVLLFCFWLSYEKSKNERLSKKQQETFIQREQAANSTRKKDISSLPYLQLPLDRLPFTETDTGTLAHLQAQVHTLAEKKILNLSYYTNTELKLIYGAANFDVLSSCDQNFSSLVMALQKWGELLLAEARTAEAEAVFCVAVDCGTDILQTWRQLAALYTARGDDNALEALLQRAGALDTAQFPQKDELLLMLHGAAIDMIASG